MEVIIKQEDLIKMTEEYVKHLGIDLTNMVYSIDFKGGRRRNGKIKNPSYAVVNVTEKINTFQKPDKQTVADTVADLKKAADENILVDKKEDTNLETMDESIENIDTESELTEEGEELEIDPETAGPKETKSLFGK